MSAEPKDNGGPALESIEECADWLRRGSKPEAEWRIGAEYERLVFDDAGQQADYEGPKGIRAVLEGLASRFGWTPVLEDGRPIALQRGQAGISLEPAGQLELSGAPLRHVSDFVRERDEHLAEVAAICEPLGLHTALVGIHPLATADSTPKVPKHRYTMMRARMPEVGTRGLDMMHLTCTVQVNLDYGDEAMAMEMMRLGMLSAPVLIALFAASPWRHGRPSGMASARAFIWEDVEPARCLPGAWIYDPAATFTDHAAWAFDVPLYFVRHRDANGQLLTLLPERKGATFRSFFEDGDRGRRPNLSDFALHLSTLFPDVRCKGVIELRACDCVPPDLLPGLPALAKGLFYDAASRRAALALLRDGDASVDRLALRHAAVRQGLDGRLGDLALGPLAVALLDLARLGLERIAPRWGEDPAALAAIDGLDAIARGERTPLWREIDEALRAKPSLLALRRFGV